MSPNVYAWLRLSPVALSTALALVILEGTLKTPWAPVNPALANHCSPPPTCDSSCDCNACDCAGCNFTNPA